MIVQSFSCELFGEFSTKSALHSDEKCRFKIDIAFKTVKILHTLEIYCIEFSDYYVSNLIPKLDLSQTKEIGINVNVELDREILESILQQNLEKLDLSCYHSKNANPAVSVFKRCPKIKDIEIRSYGCSLINKNILKELILTKRESKIDKLILYPVAKFDQADYVKLIDGHMAPNSSVQLKLKSYNK
uniref:Uncharacterized protein n=1 Tax=Panagrolaimus davidi TaxID=227884 RepID=A0A914QBS6_9BILA